MSYLAKYREKLKKMRKKSKVKPIAIFLLIVISIASYFIFQQILVTGIVSIIAVILIIVILNISIGKPSMRSLFKQRRRLLEEIRLAEKNFLKRRISKEEFEKLMQEKQAKLVKLDAQIEQEEAREEGLPAEEAKKVEEINAKRRHVLKELLAEKNSLLKERQIATIKYQKRKLTETTYKELIFKNKQRLIEIEAAIKELYGEERIENIMTELKQKLSEIEKGQKRRKIEEKEKMIEDIFEQ